MRHPSFIAGRKTNVAALPVLGEILIVTIFAIVWSVYTREDLKR